MDASCPALGLWGYAHSFKTSLVRTCNQIYVTDVLYNRTPPKRSPSRKVLMISIPRQLQKCPSSPGIPFIPIQHKA